MNAGFKWNQPIAKARGPHPVDGRMSIINVAPIEIIKNPNRREIEEIINALCMVVSELVEINEIQAERLVEVQKMIAASKTEERQNGEKPTEPVRGDMGRSKTAARKRKVKRAETKTQAERMGL